MNESTLGSQGRLETKSGPRAFHTLRYFRPMMPPASPRPGKESGERMPEEVWHADAGTAYGVVEVTTR
jgi:hypothetical protein